jgi:hypothetical protein
MIAVVRQMKIRKGSVKTSRQAVTDTWSDPDSQSAGLWRNKAGVVRLRN